MAYSSEPESHEPQAIEAGTPPLGEAFTPKLWLARISLIICVVMSVVVIWMGTHPFWYYAFPIASVWLLVEITMLTERRKQWEDLMRRREEALRQQR